MSKAKTHEEAHKRVIRGVWHAASTVARVAGPTDTEVKHLIREGINSANSGDKPRVTCRRSKQASLGWMFSVRRSDTRYKPARMKEYKANNLYSLFFFVGAQYRGTRVDVEDKA